MSKYLFGASVKGIQKFIFNTKSLREIVGASELVEQICTSFFEEHLHKRGVRFIKEGKVLMAAGNIKYIFDSKEDCEKVVFDFEYEVQKKAPGIELAMAVVKIASDLNDEHLVELEERLKVSRNKPKNFQLNALMINERSRKTGLPAIKIVNNEQMDLAQILKLEASKQARKSLMHKLVGDQVNVEQFPFEIDELTNGNKTSWIAIVHADGNNLGSHIQKMVEQLKSSEHNISKVLESFSENLESATTEAAKEAYQIVIAPNVARKKLKKIPIRPVVIGGDDISLIMGGAQAIPYTTQYLKSFERISKEKFKDWSNVYGIDNLENGLTACAGIAFVKVSYPFHYAVELAEDLCSAAKRKVKQSKNEVASALLFHKVQSSFVKEYQELKKTQLIAKGVSLSYGPYAIHNNDLKMPLVDTLIKKSNIVNEEGAPKSGIRNWLSELQQNPATSKQKMDRIKSITARNYVERLELDKAILVEEEKQVTPLYDIISLASIK